MAKIYSFPSNNMETEVDPIRSRIVSLFNTVKTTRDTTHLERTIEVPLESGRFELTSDLVLVPAVIGLASSEHTEVAHLNFMEKLCGILNAKEINQVTGFLKTLRNEIGYRKPNKAVLASSGHNENNLTCVMVSRIKYRIQWNDNFDVIIFNSVMKT